MVKKTPLGKVVGNVNGYNIRQKYEMGGRGNESKVVGSTIGVYRGKKLVETGFKNKETALEFARGL